jgi:hypothetical protein
MGADTPRATESLARRLREAGPAELAALVRERIAEIDAAAARQALRNPFVTREVVEALLARRTLLASHELRRDLAACRETPQAEALRLVPGLFWRDLMLLDLDLRVSPAVRRAASRQLTARLPALALGEKVALARRAGADVLGALRLDPSPRVVAALLDNPRLTEGLLGPLVHSERASPAVLETIAAHPRWGVRYGVRVGLSRNPRTPLAAALGVLAQLKKPDLAAVAAHPRLAPAVRRRARLLLGDRGGEPAGRRGTV